jgi:pimeloyl-ACP methyl ester carboxylesterase
MELTDWIAAGRDVELTSGVATYTEFGAGDPVILLHGVAYTSGGHDWFLAVDELARSHRVLALDLLGWGRGDRLEQPYSFARLVDFVREFQDALGLRRASVVGHSMGGWLASLLAYESPERVDRLVLVGSGGTSQRTLPSMTKFEPPALEDVVASLRAKNEGLDPEVVKGWARYAYGNVQRPDALPSYRAMLSHMNEPENRRSYNTRRRLPLIAAPTLIMWGDDDQVNDVEMARLSARLVPGAELEIVAGAGHHLPVEEPEHFASRVTAFLACAVPVSPVTSAAASGSAEASTPAASEQRRGAGACP